MKSQGKRKSQSCEGHRRHLRRSPPAGQCRQAGRVRRVEGSLLAGSLGSSGDKAGGFRQKEKKGKVPRKFSPNQEKYWDSMRSRMQELARDGVPGPERMEIAAAEWKAAMKQEPAAAEAAAE